MNDFKDWIRIENSQFKRPSSYRVKCKISHLTDHTGYVDVNNGISYPSDLDSQIHEGFTIGERGRVMYWETLFTSNGHVRVFKGVGDSGRWLDGDTEIYIHFKK